ncbi:helix-turn-helix transcriptional regulator [Herminiimonas sp. CN]|uniref:helix-turn-helix domain-containing protein n=1 Tax=Herminiimonas sp. CN TaxID=1349818 RepID=UPI0004733F6B|nr:helix-turn-helix transcriptional regulator [Herminiimonas sp. CN]
MTKDIFGETSDYIYAKNLKSLRKVWRENQTDFWYRFGVTQSRGSRFEKGIGIPPSVAILIELYLEKKVSDTDLLTALHNNNQPMGLELKVHSILGRNN